MSNNWGGKRPGAGRKPAAARPVDPLLGEAFTPEDWLALLKHLHELALGFGPDSRHAAALLMRYRFAGLPAPDESPALDDYKRHNDRPEVCVTPEKTSPPSEPTQPAALVLDVLKRYVAQASSPERVAGVASGQETPASDGCLEKEFENNQGIKMASVSRSKSQNPT